MPWAWRLCSVWMSLAVFASTWSLGCGERHEQTSEGEHDRQVATAVLEALDRQAAGQLISAYIDAQLPKSASGFRGRRDAVFAEVTRLSFDCDRAELDGFVDKIVREYEEFGEFRGGANGQYRGIFERDGKWISIKIGLADPDANRTQVDIKISVEGAK